MSYLKYTERNLEAASLDLFDALLSGGMVAEVAGFQAEYDIAVRCYNFAYQEEIEADEYYSLQEELDRQEEAWADYDYASYMADIEECYPAWRYEEIEYGWRGLIAA